MSSSAYHLGLEVKREKEGLRSRDKEHGEITEATGITCSSNAYAIGQ